MMANTPISDIWGWLLAGIAFTSAIGISFLISGVRGFLHESRGPFSNLYNVLIGVLLIGSSALQLFVISVLPAMGFELGLRLMIVFSMLLAAVAMTPFIVLISWALLRQYSLPPPAPAPRWLRQWIEQQKRADADSRERIRPVIEARRQRRVARRQA
jgi:hypothetical protein